ncbi:MAG: hypothetical protein ACRDMV_12475 [Streptosporangiales bacterium]
MDLSQLTGPITGLAGAAALVISALGRRREDRDKQYDQLVKERNEVQRRYDELQVRYDRLRRDHDVLLDWAYDLRKALHAQNIDTPDLPGQP